MSEDSIQRKQEARQGYATLIDALPYIMFRFSRDGTWLEYVGGDDESLAVPPDMFVGKLVRDVLPPISGQVEADIAEALESGKTVSFEYSLEIPVGSDNNREFEARMVKSADDEVLAIVRDVTEQNRTAEALRDEQAKNARLETLNQLALALSHHVRNAIAPMLLYASMVNADDPRAGMKLKETVEEDGARVAAILSSIDHMAASGNISTIEAWAENAPDMLDLEPLIEQYLPSR